MRPLIVIAALLLAACESVNPKAADLAPPSARLMTTPKPLPDVKEGADLYAENTRCSAEYVRETGRLQSLQRYVRTVTKK